MIFAPLRQLAEVVRSRKVSPVQLAETFLARLETLGPGLNAVVTITRERALATARRAEQEIAAGHYRGPLHGIPYGAKDLLATASGIPTSWGAAPLRTRTFAGDATVIRKLDEAGAVLVAKLAMVELAGGMGYRQPNAAFTGPGINPWNRAHWSGGSSSGSGSAVAAGLVPFALGSETWGSIVSPAGYCGIAGLRPTFGRVSRHGAMVLSWTLDKLGPLALTADDCGLVLEAIAGADPADPMAAEASFVHESTPPTRPFRFGVVVDALSPCEPAVRENFAEAVQVLKALGVVEEVRLPGFPYEATARVILAAEAGSALEELVESGALIALTAPEDRYTAYAREAVLAKDYLRALRVAGAAARAVAPILERFDALVAPGRPTVAPGVDQEFRSALRGTIGDVLGALGNFAGFPAVVVPNGFGPGGLPTSLQFVGRAWSEPAILAAARAYQSATHWHQRHPADLAAN